MFERRLGEEDWAQAGQDPSDPHPVRRADGGRAGARRSCDGAVPLQRRSIETEGRCADQIFFPPEARRFNPMQPVSRQPQTHPNAAKLS